MFCATNKTLIRKRRHTLTTNLQKLLKHTKFLESISLDS